MSTIQRGWWGKIVGGLLFYWLTGGSALWALFGVFLGHIFDSVRWFIKLGESVLFSSGIWQASAYRQKNMHHIQKLFTQSLFSVLGMLAKSDGRVSEAEIAWVESLMVRWHFSPERRQQAIEDFNRGKSEEFDLHVALADFARVARSAGLAEAFISILIECAKSDGAIDAKEWGIIERVAQQLGVVNIDPMSARRHSRAHYQRNSNDGASFTPQDALKDAYQSLGVLPSASRAEIKRAYRKLMSRHHPDKLVSQGLPEEMLEMAKEKTQEIQGAYDLICKSRGF